MRSHEKRALLHWLVTAGVLTALMWGVASAREAVDFDCKPCGCGSDGTPILCCTR